VIEVTYKRSPAAYPDSGFLSEVVVTCKCASHQTEFSSEICIHFSGRKNLDKPAVLIFPKILVCLDCGSTSFMVPQTELSLLREGCGEERKTT